MARHSSNLLWVQASIPYLQYPSLSQNGNLVHGVFTRCGGLSNPPYQSLNTSYAVGDVPESVTGNLQWIKETIGANQLLYMNQSHGDHILVIREAEYNPSNKVSSADAMITNISGLALMVKLADCQGVIIFDHKNRVLATVHCGWRGNVKNVLKKTVTRMTKEFGSSPPDLLAAISPSLGPCCAEFVTHEVIFPETFKQFMIRKNYFDLWAMSRWQLTNAGLREENIEIAGICTRCRTDLFYSYRGEGQTGRFGAVAMLA